MRMNSGLISLTATSKGMAGQRVCIWRSTRFSKVPSPAPAWNTRSAGGRGASRSNSRPMRLAVSCFSLQVVVNSRYFSRLSTNRTGR